MEPEARRPPPGGEQPQARLGGGDEQPLPVAGPPYKCTRDQTTRAPSQLCYLLCHQPPLGQSAAPVLALWSTPRKCSQLLHFNCNTVHLISGCLEVFPVCSQKCNKLGAACLMVSKQSSRASVSHWKVAENGTASLG